MKNRIEIWNIFFFLSRKQKKFTRQTPDFRNIRPPRCYIFAPPFFPSFFSPRILLTLAVSFHFSTIRHYFRVNLKEEVRDRSKSRLTLNDFVPPAPSRHQERREGAIPDALVFSSSSLSSASASPRNSASLQSRDARR